MMRAALLFAPLVAACAPHPASPADGPTRTGTGCDAAAVQHLVGGAADTTAPEALRLSGARTLRRYVTGDMLTMDYRADRLNVEVDPTGKIIKLSCG